MKLSIWISETKLFETDGNPKLRKVIQRNLSLDFMENWLCCLFLVCSISNWSLHNLHYGSCYWKKINHCTSDNHVSNVTSSCGITNWSFVQNIGRVSFSETIQYSHQQKDMEDFTGVKNLIHILQAPLWPTFPITFYLEM